MKKVTLPKIILFFFLVGLLFLINDVSIQAADEPCPFLLSGDDVKVPGKPAIYALDSNLMVRFYPSGTVYKSWKEAYKYKKITEACLASLKIPIQAPFGITYRPESGVFALSSGSGLYKINTPNILSPITSQEAINLYGVNFSTRIISDREKIDYIISTSAIKNLPPSSNTRDAGLWPFDSFSPWNMPLAKNVQFFSADDLCTKDITDPSVYISTNSTGWSIPVYQASFSDPYVDIFLDPQGGEGDGKVATIQIPFSAKPDPEDDAHIAIIDPTHHYVDEMWRAYQENNVKINTWSYRRNNLFSSGIEMGGARAFGGSALGGLIREKELITGIAHALAFAIPQTHQKCCEAVWPATEVDTPNDYSGNVPMGQLIALPSTVDINSLGLSTYGLKIAEALQHYGAYDVDSSGNFTFFIEPSAAKQLGISNEGNDLNKDLKKIQPFLRCVKNNSKEMVGGGAKDALRFAPLAPMLR